MTNINDFVNKAALELSVEGVEALGQLQDNLDDLAWNIGKEALEYWRNTAGQMLDTTSKRYQQSLYIYEDFGEGTVVGMSVDDQLVIDIEEGKPSFDMKPGLLAGRTLRVIPIGPPRDMRTVTAGQDASKWIHPGFPGLNLTEVVDTYIEETLIPKHLDELFKSL